MKTPTETERMICEDYLNGCKYEEMSKKYQVSTKTLTCIVKRNELPHRNNLPHTPTDDEITAITKDYLQGMSHKDIKNKYNIGKSVIERILNLGDSRRKGCGSKRKHKINEQAFDSITEESAYWIGMLMADGCISDEGSLKLALATKDKAHVEKFRIFLGSEHPINMITNKTYFTETAEIKISSKKICASLARFGVVPRKSHIAKVSELENNAHYWRGMIDGDGTVIIKNNYPLIQLVGSIHTCEQFQQYVLSISPECKANIHPCRSIFSFCAAGTHAVAVANSCYANCSVSLSRKHKTALQISKYNIKPCRPVDDNELFVLRNGHRVRAIWRTCQTCKQQFKFVPTKTNTNAGKYCSRKCLYGKNRIPTSMEIIPTATKLCRRQEYRV